MLDIGVSRRFCTIAIATVVFLWVVRFGVWGAYDNVETSSSSPTSTKPILDKGDSNSNNKNPPTTTHEYNEPPVELSEPSTNSTPSSEDFDPLQDEPEPEPFQPSEPSPSPAVPAAAPERKYGQIIDKVATITDTQYTDRLIPLIMHFHAVLGPEWPIVFFTSNETLSEYILPLLSDESESDSPSSTKETSSSPPSAAEAGGGGVKRRDGTPTTEQTPPETTPLKILSPPAGSASFRRAVELGSISVRTIPPEFNLSSRDGVNIYLSRPWLYEQLAPATHMLVFQADAMICANSPRVAEDFFDYAWIGAPLHPRIHYYNGGLCLRNRTMIMEILGEGALWEKDTLLYKNWTEGGEDIWFSKKMDLRGANLPSADVAMKFAAEHSWHVKPVVKGQGFRKEYENRPWGFHKVHVYARDKLEEIATWCPEIALAAKGRLEPST